MEAANLRGLSVEGPLMEIDWEARTMSNNGNYNRGNPLPFKFEWADRLGDAHSVIQKI